MSRKRTIYKTEFKTKLVLEVLKGDKTLNEIASEYNVLTKNLQNWKATFIANAEMAMDPTKVVKEYKEEIKELKAKNDKYAKTVGKMTVELEWIEGKLKSLGLSEKRELVEPELKSISITRQCTLMNLNRSSFYYKSIPEDKKEELLKEINRVFEEIPIYGSAKVHQQLLEDGHNVSLNTVFKYRKELNLKPILAVKQINTTVAIKEHKKYSYKLRSIDISRVNQVWSTDITYVKIKGGFVYLAAIIDWYSKAVLSYRISNTMDTELVMDVLNVALAKYPKPDIFNTDQGSRPSKATTPHEGGQYTSEAHTQMLKQHGITISMDGKGRATDNIVIERFWRSAKCERIYLNEYKSIKELKEDMYDYIDFYNYKRFHQTLDYKKPMDVYLKGLKSNNEFYKNDGDGNQQKLEEYGA